MIVIGIILIAASLAIFIYAALKKSFNGFIAWYMLLTSLTGGMLFANGIGDNLYKPEIERLKQKVTELEAVIGPGYATDEGMYNPNDIFYAYADSTGVTLNLESTSFYWHGSYSEAFRIMELLSNPQELTEEGSRYYQYLVSDVMASEAMKQGK